MHNTGSSTRLSRLWLVLVFLLAGIVASAGRASAQTTYPITSYTLNFYQNGVPSPVSPITFTVWTCSQTLPATYSTVNPTSVYWADPANPTLYCKAQPTQLLALPLGSYTAKLIATNAVGSSAESTASNPFDAGVSSPAAPTNLKIVR